MNLSHCGASMKPTRVLHWQKGEAVSVTPVSKAGFLRRRFPGSLVMIMVFASLQAGAQSGVTTPGAVLRSRQGPVEFTSAARTNWAQATNTQRLLVRDRLRTLELGQAAVQMQDLSIIRLKEWTTLEMLPPREVTEKVQFSLKVGAAYFLHRNEPRQIGVETPAVRAGIDGTEFHLLVEADGRTTLTLIDGKVTLSNPFGTLQLASGEQGVTVTGQAPVKTARIDARNIIQWCLYYPGVLDPEEPGLTTAEAAALSASLSAYRSGDLIQGFANYPEARLAQQRSAVEEAFYLGLKLSSGRVTNYTEFVSQLSTINSNPFGTALRTLVAAVNSETNYPPPAATNASQLLANSYLRQSRFQLADALKDARAAVQRSPNFAFGWERVAELEFSLGRLPRAEEALRQALRLAPRNAQAHALNGFLLLSRDRLDEALKAFDAAIVIDMRLGNAWLGRGLALLRQRRPVEGLQSIEQAAAMEPNRWLLRSYLGKAFTLAADAERGAAQRERFLTLAEEELELAKRQDPLDPTPWLYSALLREQENRTIEAVRDLEQSVALNDNRQTFRSRLLLDEDRAVRHANLARVYQRAGLLELSLQQASRAVTENYADYNPHRFLADSYNALRDPKRVNLRDEAIWSSETLIANLLGAGGGGSLSRFVSQQEYSTQFRETGTGVFSATEYGSSGDWRETASQFGTFEKFSYAVDVEYQHLHGDRPNSDLDRLEWFSQAKFKLSRDDSVFVQTKYQDLDSGDIVQYYDPAKARKNLHFSEVQDPLIFAGYQHQWTEGIQTLFLASRLVNDLRYHDLDVSDYAFTRDTPGSPVNAVDTTRYDLRYQNSFETYSVELNQILKVPRQTFIAGARYQNGSFETANQITDILGAGPALVVPPSGDQDSSMERSAAYLYDTVEVLPQFYLTAGLSYDRLRYPENLRNTPVSVRESKRDQLSPKAGLSWTPLSRVTLRGAYARSLTGVSFEDSVRLEPTQLAGFIQSFRNIIPESLEGSIAGARHETAGLALDWPFLPGSYFGVQAEWLHADVARPIGVFDFTITPERFAAGTTRQKIDYEERSIAAVFTHHLSTELTVGTRYRFTQSGLDRHLTEVSTTVFPGAKTHEEANLHQLTLFLQQEYPSGLYGLFQSRWNLQDNAGCSLARPGEDFWQFDLFIGWRFWRNHVDATLGLLNLTDQNYRLNPLTPHNDLPRRRELIARLRFNF